MEVVDVEEVPSSGPRRQFVVVMGTADVVVFVTTLKSTTSRNKCQNTAAVQRSDVVSKSVLG